MIRFFTRDRKPKLYNLLILTAVTALLTAFLLLNGSEKATRYVCYLLAAYYAGVVFVLLMSFVRQLQYNPYSYNTIYYMGFALFAVSIFLVHLLITLNLDNYPAEYRLLQVFNSVLSSAKTYMILTSPVIFFFSILLFASNISLLRHEGRRLTNYLGIGLSFILVGGIVYLYVTDFYTSGSQWEVMVHDLLTNLYAAIYLYFECMVIGVVIANAIVSRYEPDHDRDFVIILGCGLNKDGSLTPLLRGRADRALAFCEKQKRENGKELMFITSGGQGPDEVISESAAIRNYLISRGIPSALIIEEDRSTNTEENMKYSREKADEQMDNARMAFSTTTYHVFRSGLYGRRAGMKAQGMGARTKWYFWPNAAVREFVGLLTEHRVKQALIITSMIALYILMTLFSYGYL